MDRLTLRLPPDLARRFDAAAAGRGGRSRFLRSLMEAAAQAPVPEAPDRPPGGGAGKLTLRLGADDLALVEAAAAGVVVGGSRQRRDRREERMRSSRP